MRNKRIILAVTNDLTFDRRMNRICSALAEEGAQVTLVGRQRRESIPFVAAKFKGHRLKCWFNKGVLFYKEYNFRLFFYLLHHPFDIACACDLDTAMAVRLAAWWKREKTVYDAHEYFTEVPELSHRPVVKRIWTWIARMTIPGFQACYTVGEELATIMGKKYGVHFEVIRNIEPSTSSLPIVTGVGSRRNIMLYQGALNVGRGLEASILAMAQLPEWEFWLAGDGDITERLKELTRQHGVGERVKFLGWVQPEDLPALLSQAKLNINLREAGSLNDYYSLPNKFFDAIHAGLPSIHMNYPEYARICAVYPCAILLNKVSVENIVTSVHNLDRHPEQWLAMSDACRAAAGEYTWEKESQKLIRIYSGL